MSGARPRPLPEATTTAASRSRRAGAASSVPGASGPRLPRAAPCRSSRPWDPRRTLTMVAASLLLRHRLRGNGRNSSNRSSSRSSSISRATWRTRGRTDRTTSAGRLKAKTNRSKWGRQPWKFSRIKADKVYCLVFILHSIRYLLLSLDPR